LPDIVARGPFIIALTNSGVSDADRIGQPRKLLRLIAPDGDRGASFADADNFLRLKNAPDRQPIALIEPR